MSGRTLFVAVAGGILLLLFVVVVVIPAVARGGWLEVAGVVALIAAVLIVERWLRSRGP